MLYLFVLYNSRYSFTLSINLSIDLEELDVQRNVLPNIFPGYLYAIFIKVKMIVANKWKRANNQIMFQALKFT